MKQEHLLENELQQFALGLEVNNQELAAHVHECAKCTMAVANYRSMFSALTTMEKPVLNVDLEQIMAALPVITAEKKQFPWLVLWVSLIPVAVTVIPVFKMKSFFSNLFGNISGPVFYLIITTALTILIFQLRELYTSYREKMRLLNFY